MLIIDDAESALRLMPDDLVDAIAPAVERWRASVLAHATAVGATIISHTAFAKWARDRLSPTTAVVSLDPLLGPSWHPGVATFEIHRHWWGEGLNLRLESVPSLVHATEVVVVDDASYTGSTLGVAVDALAAAGRKPDEILLGVAKSSAGQAVPRVAVRAFHTISSGDVLHLRDFCPMTPYSGRESEFRDSTYRVAALLADEGDTIHLLGFPAVRAEFIERSGEILHTIDHWVGHPISPAELRDLCPTVALPLPSRLERADPEQAFAIMRSAFTPRAR